nr:class E sortase [Streptomyces sp. SS]
MLWVCAEAVVTCGVVVLLLVVHQLWWTNQEARAEARGQVSALEREWGMSPRGEPGEPGGAGEPGESGGAGESGGLGGAGGSGEAVGAGEAVDPLGGGGGGGGGGSGGSGGRGGGGPGSGTSAAFAVLRIPRIGLTAPVAYGVSKRSVLDRGYVGQYRGTAGPGAVGNFALAGHRNTHGEPFRYINRLAVGDEISVRTRARTYVYRVDQVLRSTSPRDVGVIRPVPRSIVKPSYGYGAPGAYLTLTTCTPEFSSAYRLVVWAKLVSAG